jgi:flagellar hook-associated protein 3 FlgL
MGSSSSLRALEQYRRNVETGQARLSVEDSVLDQVGNALIRAKELSISQGSDTATAATRVATKAEIDGLLDYVTDLGNTQFAGSYMFGGDYADQKPFTGAAYNPAQPPSGSLKVEIGAGLFVDTNHSAQDILLDTNVVDALQDLSTALGANDEDAIRTAAASLDAAFQSVQEVVGDLGARMSQLDVTVANLDSLEVTLETFRAGLTDADLAEAVTDLVNRQTTMEAAMLANSKILNITLTDYL